MDAFHARHAGLLDPEAVRSRRVTVLGAGSLGSVIALHLARAGVGRFRLFDMDRVAEPNLCRTAYVAADVGRPKVAALAGHLRAVRAGIEVEASETDVMTMGDEAFRAACAWGDLVVAVTDHPVVQARAGALAYHAVPAVFSGVYARGTGGEVFWTSPDETPCHACIVGAIRGATRDMRAPHAYGVATAQTEAVPALGIDVAHVAVLAAKVSLALLLRGTGAPAEALLDPARTVLFVGNDVDWIWREPMETVWARATRLDSCLCRLAPDASTAGLLLPPEAQ